MCPLMRAHGKLISSAIFAQLTAEYRQACPGMSFSLIIAPSYRGSGPHLIHASLGPSESITHMASGSFSRFCTAHSSVCLNFTIGRTFPFKIAPSNGEICTPIPHDSLGPSEPTSQSASQPFLHSSAQSVPILYNRLPLLPSKFPLPIGVWTPI